MTDAYQHGWRLTNVPLTAVAVAESGQRNPSPTPEFGVTGKDLIQWEIPSFQRGLRWKSDKRAEFYSSLFDGWPVGILVLAESGNDEIWESDARLRTFQIIDGQQRTYAINALVAGFWTAPWYRLGRYSPPTIRRRTRGEGEIPAASPTEAACEVAIEAIALHLSVPAEIVSSALQDSIAASATPREYLADGQGLLEDLICRSGSSADATDRAARLQAVGLGTRLIKQHDSVLETTIPVLIIREELKANLPEIFRALNSGLPLGPYDLLAAEWFSIRLASTASEIYVDNFSLIQQAAKSRIEGQYKALSDDYEYDPNVAELLDSDLTLYDYLYGLSSVLASSSAVVDSDRARETLAFQTLALLYTGQAGVTATLSSYFPEETQTGGPDLTRTPQVMLRVRTLIEQALSGPMNVDVRKRTLGGKLGLVQSSTYLASGCALVGRVAMSTNKPHLEMASRNSAADQRLRSDNSRTWTSSIRANAFKTALCSWYLLDILEDQFQGSSAYTNARTRVWSEFNHRPTPVFYEDERMLSHAPLEAILLSLADLFVDEAQVDRTPGNRRISEGASAVFRLTFSGMNVSGDELDHVIPFSAKPKVGNITFGGVAPMNHVANWMPIESALNNGRQNMPWSEYIDGLPADKKHLALERLLISPHMLDGAAMATRASMLKVLLSRYEKMTDRVLLAINHPDYVGLSSEDRIILINRDVSNNIAGRLSLIEN